MKASKATGRVKLGIARLASLQPLSSALLARWRLEESEATNTMTIGMKRGRLTLQYNPKWVDTLALPEVTAVLCHEANHFLMGHLDGDGQFPHRRAMVAAEETVANQWVPDELPLPGSPITLADFPDLSPDDDTQTRYDKLRLILPDTPIIEWTLDDHDGWDSILAGGALAQAVTTTCLAEAWESLSPEQKNAVPAPVQQKAQAASAQARTSLVGSGRATVPWQLLLRRYVGRSLQRRPVFGRPPRRFPELVGIIPGKARSGSRPRIMAVVDTSGSITSAMLAAISAELAVMARNHDVTVVEADDQVRATYKYRPITTVSGRGGTDFRPALALAARMRVDLVIYCTDGHGKLGQPPRCYVLWLLTPGGKHPCSWGRVIRMT